MPKGGSANTTLVVRVPADAAAGTLAAFSFRGRDSANNIDVTAVKTVNVTVVAPPAPATPTATNAPPPPSLKLQTTGTSDRPDRGFAGSDVHGVLTLLHEGSEPSLRVDLDIAGVASWKPVFTDGTDFRVLSPMTPVRVPIRVTVPDLAEDVPQSFTLIATAGGAEFRAVWHVIGLAQPRTTTESPAATDTDAGTANATAPSPARAPTPGPGMSISLTSDVIDIASGESATGAVRVVNTGGSALRITLSGSAPAPEWGTPLFDGDTFDLAPGAARDVSFRLSAPLGIPLGGSGAGTIVAQSGSGLVRSIPYKVNIVPPTTPRDTTSPSTETAAPVDASLPQTNTVALAFAAGAAAVGAGAIALANRPLREKLLWAAVGLYTRIARPDVLGHEDRERLYRLVESQPGIHFHALQRDLAWNTGTLTYHLRVLERHGFMVSRRDGLYRRFYLQGAAPRKEVFENQGPTGLRADVLEAVRNQHGISQTDLALALSANKQTVNYHVKALERQGLIRVEKRGRDTYLYPQDVVAPDAARA